MAITEQQAHELPLDDLRNAINAEARAAAQAQEKPAELQQIEKNFADFVAATPDFQKSPENIQTLMNHIAWTRPPTVDDLTLAHAQAVYRKEYKAPEVQPEMSPEKMPLHQLREAAFGGPERDPAFAMDLNQLRKEAGLES